VAKSQIKKLTKICAREKMKEAEADQRNVGVMHHCYI